MAKKSITPSIRMNEEQYLKLKELKEKSGKSWNKLIKRVNTMLENDMAKNGGNDHDKQI